MKESTQELVAMLHTLVEDYNYLTMPKVGQTSNEYLFNSLQKAINAIADVVVQRASGYASDDPAKPLNDSGKSIQDLIDQEAPF